jgi:hypothetical protein
MLEINFMELKDFIGQFVGQKGDDMRAVHKISLFVKCQTQLSTPPSSKHLVH